MHSTSDVTLCYGPERAPDSSVDHDVAFFNTLIRAITGINALGIHSVRPTDLARLLPSDRMEPAIEIMADVRAYFQGGNYLVVT